MPIESFTAAEAMGRLRESGKKVLWPDSRKPSGKRLETVALPEIDAHFSISPDDRLFTMGSCFARNIERRLIELDFDVTQIDTGFESRFEKVGGDRDYLNRYNIATMRTEMGWALGEDMPPIEQRILEIDGEGYDLFCNFGKLSLPYDEARSIREEVDRRQAAIRDCRVIILTLGYVEAWKDNASGLIINRAPPARAIKAEPDRFTLEVLSFEDVRGHLAAIHDMVAAHGHPDARFLVTVSPVPLQMTFRPQDVLTANLYSKSVQRAALEDFALAHDNVDYFPSYEAVTLTDRRTAFETDNRHVQYPVVARIVDKFIRSYAPEVDIGADPDDLEASVVNTVRDMYVAAKEHMNGGRFLEAEPFFERVLAHDDHELEDNDIARVQVEHKYAGCLYKLRKGDKFEEVTRRLLDRDDVEPSMVLRALELCRKMGRKQLKYHGQERAVALGIPDAEIRAAAKGT